MRVDFWVFQQLANCESRFAKTSAKLADVDAERRNEAARAHEARAQYERLRSDVLDGNCESDEFDEANVLRARLDEARIANVELERLVESLRIRGDGDEFERRYEETTRRLIHVAIQLHGHERRVAAVAGRQRLLVDELATTRARLTQLVAGDDRRTRALSRENVP